MISSGLLTQLYEVPQKTNRCSRPAAAALSVIYFLQLAVYALLFSMSFAVNIASPYFAVYQLHSLNKLFHLRRAGTASSVATLFTISRWDAPPTASATLKCC